MGQFNVAIGIATRGRPAILKETLGDLLLQSRPAECILVAYIHSDDIGDAPAAFPQVRFIQGTPETGGSCAQRNRLLDAAGRDYDLLLFLDDDFFLHREYLARMAELFEHDPQVLGATGVVLADGAKGAGLTGAFARDRLAAVAAVPSLGQAPPFPAFNTYGCNMIFRVGALARHNIRFDEQLPAYGWYEDLDFSRRLLPFGTLMVVPGAQGVHLGVKLGRTSGVRFGYSQVANPIYLSRKGSYPWQRARWSILRNCLANLFHSIRPEPYLDRRGRLRGNLLAFREALTGRLRPDRILDLH